jgi:hypothetical protein
VLLLSATACSSDSDSAAETLPEAAAENTVGSTDAPTTAAPSTDPAADTTTTGGEGTTSEPAPTEPAVVVPEALQFTAPLVGGGTFDGAAAAGKPTVFWFWAPT